MTESSRAVSLPWRWLPDAGPRWLSATLGRSGCAIRVAARRWGSPHPNRGTDAANSPYL